MVNKLVFDVMMSDVETDRGNRSYPGDFSGLDGNITETSGSFNQRVGKIISPENKK